MHVIVFVFYLIIRRPPRSTRTDTLFPTRRSSDLGALPAGDQIAHLLDDIAVRKGLGDEGVGAQPEGRVAVRLLALGGQHDDRQVTERSEEHTSELQSQMRISYAVFCLTTKIPNNLY